jgi:hypothetical protein
VYRSPNDAAPFVIKLSEAQAALIREQSYLNPKALANEIRQESSMFMAAARFDGRLI